MRVVVKGGVALGAVLGLALATPLAVQAQSLFGSRGLGVAVTPADGRIAALGGLGVALPGPSPSLLNPADATEVSRRGVIVSLQPSTTELEVADGTGSVDATRFPLVQLFLPIGSRMVATAGYGAFLDQNWGVRNESIVPLGADTVNAIDDISSRGGIAQGTVGMAYRITDGISLGLGVGMLTGSATREVHRRFTEDGVGLAPFDTRTKTSYTAPMASVGVRWRASMVRLGAALTWTGDLSVDEAGDESDVGMPLRAVGGASVQLLDDLLVTLSGRWSGWSAASDALTDTSAEDVIEVGGGIEWSGIRTVRRVFPVRIGARWGSQPFSFGGEAPGEAAVSFGLGARLSGSAESPGALVDFAVERGARGDLDSNGLSETFWRATASVSLFAL